jgi:hypothetical protein
MPEFGLRKITGDIKNQSAIAFIFESLWINLFEVVDQPCLTVEIHRIFVWLRFDGINPNCTATTSLRREVARLLLAQCFINRANAVGCCSHLINEVAQLMQSFSLGRGVTGENF